MAKTQELTAEEVDQLWKLYMTDRDCNGVRNRLVEVYLPLARMVAKSVRRRMPLSIELDELISASHVGLIQAVSAFDPSHGVNFKTYATRRIRGAILDYLREMDWVPRLVRIRGEEFPTVRGLDEKIAMGDDHNRPVRLADVLEDHQAKTPADAMDKKCFLKTVLVGLRKKERLLMILYYYESNTMKQIAQQIGISEGRVCQLHDQIVRRLQERFAADPAWRRAIGESAASAPEAEVEGGGAVATTCINNPG